MVKSKKTKKLYYNKEKKTVKQSYSSDNLKSVWVFDRIDRSGKFAFDINREYFDHKLFMDKMISYSNMTWQEIITQTHDNKNKSKNHFISADVLIKEVKDSIIKMKLEEYSDSIFSFAFTNTLRIFGYRENEFFHVLWYDQNHEICPMKK